MTYVPCSEEEVEYLDSYDPRAYPVTMLTVDLAVFTYDVRERLWKVLLVKRGNYPHKNCWALPGGFMDPHETLQQAAVRELQEETGLTVSSTQVRMLRLADAPDRDPRGRAVSAVFTAQIPHASLRAGDDAQETCWVPLQILDRAVRAELAFDHGALVLDAGRYWGLRQEFADAKHWGTPASSEQKVGEQ